MTHPRAGLHVALRASVGVLEIDVTLEVRRGCLVLVGPNGAGKSTLLSLIIGALRPLSGHIRIDVDTLVDSERRMFTPVECRRFGYVPQSSALLPNQSVREHVEFALNCGGGAHSRAEKRRQLDAILSQFGLAAHADRKARMLSGGEMQRLALARAVATRPRALLLDEPFSALDAGARHGVRSFLDFYLKSIQIPTIVVTHDAKDACVLGERIAVMERGRITQVGAWQDLVARPGSEFVRQLVSGTDESLRSLDTPAERRRYLSAV